MFRKMRETFVVLGCLASKHPWEGLNPQMAGGSVRQGQTPSPRALQSSLPGPILPGTLTLREDHREAGTVRCHSSGVRGPAGTTKEQLWPRCQQAQPHSSLPVVLTPSFQGSRPVDKSGSLSLPCDSVGHLSFQKIPFGQ